MSDVSSAKPDPKTGPAVENPASASAIQRLGLIFAVFTVLLFYVLITSWPVVEGPNATQFKPFRLFGLYCDWPADKRMLFTVIMAGAIGSLVHALTSFTDFDDAMGIANDTLYGLGAGVWSRDGNTAYRAGREIKAGRVWVNCYHVYPPHSAFGGYKQSGFGRETHKMALDHYQQTKNLLVSYADKAQGFF